MRKILFAFVAFVAFVAPRRSAAQFIGYVSPQTVQQTIATNTNCTGAAQTFPINNLGQVQHYLTLASIVNAQTFQAEIDGIDVQGNVYTLSDTAEMPGLSITRQGVLYGSGYYPQLQARITCTPNTATFSASYAGGWGTSAPTGGASLRASIDTVNFFNISATVNQNDSNVPTPFGSSAGTLYFQYNTSTPTGTPTLSVACSTLGVTASTFVTSFTPAATTALQVFQIPDQACPLISIQFTSTGTGTTLTAEYVFAPPGLSNHASTDPCSAGTFQKTTAAISAAAGATTQIIAGSTGKSIYVCGYQMSQVATAGTLQWVYGTGASCGTGTTNLSGAMGVTASQPITYGTGEATVFKVPMGNALCLTTSGAGGTASGIITLIQSP